MVATAGLGWRLAPCLDALFDEADRRKPTRSHAADGTIGDQAHAARVSDHNPDDGWVCAGDVDDDNDSSPILGVDLLVKHLTDTRDPRVKYVIRNGRIWSPDRGWRAYTGINGHFHHAHISVWNTAAARNDLRPWWPVIQPPKPKPPAVSTEDDDMPVIIKADGRPARLLDAPFFVPLDAASATSLKASGMKEHELTPGDYDELRGQCLKALGLPG